METMSQSSLRLKAILRMVLMERFDFVYPRCAEFIYAFIQSITEFIQSITFVFLLEFHKTIVSTLKLNFFNCPHSKVFGQT